MGTCSVKPGWTHLIQHKINTPPEVLIFQRLCQVSKAQWQGIEAEMACMHQDDTIEKSTRLWSNPIVVVTKSDIMVSRG